MQVGYIPIKVLLFLWYDKLAYAMIISNKGIIMQVKIIFVFLTFFSCLTAKDKAIDLSKIHGRIEYVNAFADYKVEVVNSFPDLKVKEVSAFPDKAGQWQIVTSFPDFKIQKVSHFGDFKIKYVSSFEGVK